MEISSQFTEDAIASVATPCERCSKIIQIGQKRLYVAPQGRPDKPGKYVCEQCMAHYLEKVSTTARAVPWATSISIPRGETLILILILCMLNFLK